MSAGNPDFDDIVHDEAQRFGADVQAIIDGRAIIEQTKGMLMVVYGIDDHAAFQMLRQQSRHHNIKLRVIAEQIRQDLIELCVANPPLRQRNATNILLTAHHRIAAVVARSTDGQSKVAGQ